MQLIYLMKGLELSPTAVERIVARVPKSAYDEKRDLERFSFRQAVAHLADWETINLERIRQVLEDRGSTIQGRDEGQRAIDQGYDGLDPRAQVRVFAENRRATLAVLSGLAEDEWSRQCLHSERGWQTVYEQAVTILGHDMTHLEQLSQYMG